MRILAAGDHFVAPDLFARELTAEIGTDHTIDQLHLPWPLTPFGPVSEVDEASGDEDTLLAALRGSRVCVTQMAPVTRKVLDGSPDLRLVVVGRGGPVNVNLDAAKERGVQVCNTPDATRRPPPNTPSGCCWPRCAGSRRPRRRSRRAAGRASSIRTTTAVPVWTGRPSG